MVCKFSQSGKTGNRSGEDLDGVYLLGTFCENTKDEQKDKNNVNSKFLIWFLFNLVFALRI